MAKPSRKSSRQGRKSPSAPSGRPGMVSHVELRRDRVPSFVQYPFNIPAIRGMNVLPLHPAVTFLIGENGSGKSTLLEAMATQLGFNPEGGSKNFNFSTRQSHSELWKYLELPRDGAHRSSDGFFLRAESYFNVASELERLGISLRSYGGRSPHEQSHGESFLSLMQHRFKWGGIYLLDEPEAALSHSACWRCCTTMQKWARNSSLRPIRRSSSRTRTPSSISSRIAAWSASSTRTPSNIA
ncbi:MAG: AAA family ATPase [Phycisphaerales bacterium]|nr:AAA family ATPase [Phycisphaerales bacterium]